MKLHVPSSYCMFLFLRLYTWEKEGGKGDKVKEGEAKKMREEGEGEVKEKRRGMMTKRERRRRGR